MYTFEYEIIVVTCNDIKLNDQQCHLYPGFIVSNRPSVTQALVKKKLAKLMSVSTSVPHHEPVNKQTEVGGCGTIIFSVGVNLNINSAGNLQMDVSSLNYFC